MIRLLVGVFLCSLFFFSSCATWYERTSEFQQTIETGNFEKADKLLRKDKRMAKGKNKILFYLNLGYVELWLVIRKKAIRLLKRRNSS